MPTWLRVLLQSYLIGSIPWGYLVVRWIAGRDIRREGDGNVGTRNAVHAAGWRAGAITLLLDGLKGAVVCWLALYQGMQSWLLYLAGFGLVLGHGFPIWLKGRGGKGLAAEAGFLLVLWPGFTSVALLGLGITQLLRVPFDYCVAVAAILFIGLLTTFGQDARDVGFVVALLASSGLKKLVDRPHEQALRCQGVGADGQASCHLH